MTRVPPGHPEGYLEGFANIYSEVALAIKAARSGKKPPRGVHFPTIDDGVKGLAFIEAAVKSSKANGNWVRPEFPASQRDAYNPVAKSLVQFSKSF